MSNRKIKWQNFFKPLKYHEQEVSCIFTSSVLTTSIQCTSLHPYKLRNTGVFFHLLTLQAFNLGIPGATVHHHMKMERGRIVKEWIGKTTETLPLAGSAPATQRIWIHTMKDFVVFLLYFLTGFFFYLKNHITAKAGSAKLLFKNHHSVWLSFCRQASYWSISH